MYFSLRLWSYTVGARLQIALAVALGLATAATGVARLALLGWMTARVFEGESIGDLVPEIAAVVAISVARVLLQYAKESVAYTTSARVQRTVRRRLLRRVLALGPSYFNQKRTGDVSISLVEGVDSLETFFGQYLPQFFVAALAPIGVFIFMAFLDLPVAAIYLGFALVTLALPSLLHRWNAAASRRRRDAYGSFGADFLDSIQGLATLKAFGQSKARSEALERRAHEVFRSTMGVLVSNAFTQGITILAIAVGAAAALSVGAARVEDGDMSLTVLLVILLLGVEVFRPLRELSQLFHQGLMGIAAAQGVWDVLDAKPIVEDVAPAPEGDALEASLTFDRVTFAYPGGRRAALEDVSFEVPSGQRVGLVGPSGAGKSTLMWLLQRLYDPDRGRIVLGGRDLRELSFAQIRGQISVVAQDTYLFYGTVAENLRFGNGQASQEQLEAAARAANAHDFISQMPAGYETVIGERGQRLSGGERQRVAIARALLRDTPILVLDEALSSVDIRNEATIQEALDRLMAGRTTLIMAHRLSSVIDCDTILVLNEGELVESGPHAALIAQGGVYAELMASQAEAGAAESPIAEMLESMPKREAYPSAIAGEVDTAPTDAIVRAEGMGWGETARRLLAQAAPEWPKVVATFVAGVARFVGLIAVAAVGALMVANVKDGDAIGPLMALLLSVAVATAVFTWLENWVAHDMAFRLLSQMRIALFRQLDSLAPAYLTRRRTGDLVSMATQDVETVEYFFAHTIANAFVSVVVPGGILITLALFRWELALGLAPFLALAAATPFLAREAIDRIGSRSRDQLGRLNAHAVDTLQGLREVVAFQREDARRTEFDALIADYIPLRLAFNRQITTQRVLVEALVGLGGLTVLTIGGLLASDGKLAATDVPLLTLLAMGAFLPIAEMAMIGRRLGDTLGATRRLAAVHNEVPVVADGPGVAPRVPAAATADLKAVDFRYDHANRLALEGVSFDLAPGATVALVGPSGAGKTTAAHLLLRFWDPVSGALHLDGDDLRTYRLEEMRERIALVAQDTYLFNASIRENLLVAQPDASDEEILEAIARAGLADFVESLPEGLDTVVGERGAQLSGGQRQRVAIGRALLKDAPLLILDEATSHLDGGTERLVREALDELMRDRTTLVIAHRLSTVRDADLIVVLDRGRIVEAGTHEDLLGTAGLYAELVSHQTRAAATTGAGD